MASVLACMHTLTFLLFHLHFLSATIPKLYKNLSIACFSAGLQSMHTRFWLVLACMHIFIIFIVGSLLPFWKDSKSVSRLSVACSSVELQSVHTIFLLVCLHACTYLDFYCWIFISYLQQFQNGIKLIYSLFQC